MFKPDIDRIMINGDMYHLGGWNGLRFLDCKAETGDYVILPVYGSHRNTEEINIIGYEVSFAQDAVCLPH